MDKIFKGMLRSLRRPPCPPNVNVVIIEWGWEKTKYSKGFISRFHAMPATLKLGGQGGSHQDSLSPLIILSIYRLKLALDFLFH